MTKIPTSGNIGQKWGTHGDHGTDECVRTYTSKF